MTRTLSGCSPSFPAPRPGGVRFPASSRIAVRRIPALSASAAPDRKEASFSSGAAGWTTGTFLIKTPSGHRFSVLSLARLFRLLSFSRRPRRYGSSLFITGFGEDGLLAYDSLENGFIPVRALVRTPGAGGMRRLVFSEGRLLDAFPGCRPDGRLEAGSPQGPGEELHRHSRVLPAHARAGRHLRYAWADWPHAAPGLSLRLPSAGQEQSRRAPPDQVHAHAGLDHMDLRPRKSSGTPGCQPRFPEWPLHTWGIPLRPRPACPLYRSGRAMPPYSGPCLPARRG